MPAAVVKTLRTTVDAPPTLDADEATLEAIDAGLCPARRPSRRCGRCRSGRARARGSVARRRPGGGGGRRRRAAGWRPCRRRARPRRRELSSSRSGSCTAQTSKPCGAQSDASAVVIRTVRNSSPDPASGRPPGQVDHRALAGPERRQLERATGDLDAVGRQRVARPQPAEVAEMLVVGDLDPACLEVGGRAVDADRRRQPLVLPHRRLRTAVRPDHPVAHEVAVVGLVAEVAAVRPVRPPVRQSSGPGRDPRTPR